MRLGKYLTSRTRSELEEVESALNLTDDELLVFKGLVRGHSITMIADHCDISSGTVSNRIKAIKYKLEKLEERR